MKLGYLIYINRKTPKIVKKIFDFRWAIISTIKENRERKKHKDSIFSIAYDNKKKIRFYLPIKKEAIQQSIIVKKEFFEKINLDIIKKYLPKQCTIIDIGANIGNHSMYFSLMNSSNKIYAFEPHNINYDILKKNIKINNLKNITTYNMAVGNKEGSGILIEQDNNNLCDTMVEYNDKGNIQFISLDTFIDTEKLTKIDLIKIDVEGFEEYVIKGMARLIDKYDPIYWIEIWEDKKEVVFNLLKTYNLIEIHNDQFSRADNYLFKKR